MDQREEGQQISMLVGKFRIPLSCLRYYHFKVTSQSGLTLIACNVPEEEKSVMYSFLKRTRTPDRTHYPEIHIISLLTNKPKFDSWN